MFLLDFLGIEIINDIVDDACDDGILFVVEESLHHQMEVRTLDVVLDALEEFLLLEGGQLVEDAVESSQAVLQLLVVALAHGLPHALRQHHVDAQLEHHAQLAQPCLLEHHLHQRQDAGPEGRNLAE